MVNAATPTKTIILEIISSIFWCCLQPFTSADDSTQSKRDNTVNLFHKKMKEQNEDDITFKKGVKSLCVLRESIRAVGEWLLTFRRMEIFSLFTIHVLCFCNISRVFSNVLNRIRRSRSEFFVTEISFQRNL